MSELKENKLDQGVALTKGIAGVIPIAGPIISEIISTIIPNQRIDRIAKFLEILDQKISKIEQETLKKDKYFVDLFEDCLIQATRALSEKRNRYIAIFLSKSNNLDKATYNAKKKLLHILEELTDQDIDFLKNIKSPLQQDNSFYGGLSYGSYQRLSDQDRLEYDILNTSRDASINSLERSGLITLERMQQDKDNIEHFPNLHINDETGLPKITGSNISDLGKALLALIEE